MGKTFDFDDLPASTSPWLIDNLIPLGHFCVLLAQSGKGKSFLLEGLLTHLVFEKDFLGFPTQFGDVCLIDQDTPQNVLQERLHRFASGIRNSNNPKHTLYLCSMEGHYLHDNSLVHEINKYDTRLTVIDSLHSVCGKLNPNKTNDMAVFARLKENCLKPNKTIILVHHITEKISPTLQELMCSDSHISGMGNSAIKQQADTEYVLASTIVSGKIERIFLRSIGKRLAIEQKPIIIRLLEPNPKAYLLEFEGYLESDLNEVEVDILLLHMERPLEYSIKETRDIMGNKYGEKAIRQAYANLERKGKVIMSRHRANLFKYKLVK